MSEAFGHGGEAKTGRATAPPSRASSLFGARASPPADASPTPDQAGAAAAAPAAGASACRASAASCRSRCSAPSGGLGAVAWAMTEARAAGAARRRQGRRHRARGRRRPDRRPARARRRHRQRDLVLRDDACSTAAAARSSAANTRSRQASACARSRHELIAHKVVQHKLTIPEGLTSDQVVQRLRDDDVLVGDVKEPPREGSLLPGHLSVRARRHAPGDARADGQGAGQGGRRNLGEARGRSADQVSRRTGHARLDRREGDRQGRRARRGSPASSSIACRNI